MKTSKKLNKWFWKLWDKDDRPAHLIILDLVEDICSGEETNPTTPFPKSYLLETYQDLLESLKERIKDLKNV